MKDILIAIYYITFSLMVATSMKAQSNPIVSQNTVLGYSDQDFDFDDMPPALQALLEVYQPDTLVEAKLRRANSWHTPGLNVEPMLKTKWGQGYPYNMLVPEGCPVGCASVALAQIIRYYGYSHMTSNEIPSYEIPKLGIMMSALPPTEFNYELMENSYEESDECESAQEVAKFLLYVACGLKVDFSPNGSGTVISDDKAAAITQLFGYDCDAHVVYRTAETSNQEWIDQIEQELAACRPILFGASAGGGHAFVIDGVRGIDGFLHINWGWNGVADGWYHPDLLNPYLGSGGYTFGQHMMVGLEPHGIQSSIKDKQPMLKLIVTPQIFDGKMLSNETYLRNQDGDFEDVNLKSVIYTEGDTAGYDTELGIAVYQGGKVMEVLSETKTYATGKWAATWNGYQTFGKALPDGTYELRNVFKIKGQEVWQPVKNAFIYHVRADIHGDTLRLEQQPNLTLMVEKVEAAKRNVSHLKVVVLSLTLHNKSTIPSAPIYLHDADTGEFLYQNLLFLDPNHTEMVQMEFVNRHDTQHIRLTTRMQGKEILLYSGPLTSLFAKYDENTTDLPTIMPCNEQPPPLQLYDLNGRAITAPPTSGIYIRTDGKKILAH